MVKIYFVCTLVMAAFLVSCTNETKKDEIVVSEVDSTFCQCMSLSFDEPYNHFYRVDRTKPFTGDCEDSYSNGQLKIQKTLLEGKNHGIQKKFFENGQLAEVKEFDMNFQIGAQLNFDRKGDTTFYATYKRGIQTEVFKLKRDYELVK